MKDLAIRVGTLNSIRLLGRLNGLVGPVLRKFRPDQCLLMAEDFLLETIGRVGDWMHVFRV